MSGYGCVLNNKLLSERLCILIYSNNSSFNWMHTLYKEYILTFCNKDWLKRISYDINTDEYEDVVLLWSSFSHGLAFNKRTSSPILMKQSKMNFHVCTFLVVCENISDKQDSISSGFNWCCILLKNVRS